MITKQNWIDAGAAIDGIDPDEVEKQLGKKIKSRDWEDFCKEVYSAVLPGRMPPACRMHGRGSRSRWYGEQVASVWPDSAPQSTPHSEG